MMKQVTGDAVTVRFFMPSPELAPYFTTYYLTEVKVPETEEVEDWLHPEWANVRFPQSANMRAAVGSDSLARAPDMIATGPTSLAGHFVSGPFRNWGIGIQPLGWARFCQGPAADLADRYCDGSTSAAFAAFRPLAGQLYAGAPDPAGEAARIDAFLLSLLAKHPPAEDEARIRAAHAALMDHEIGSVGELAERLGMSARSLERLSLRAFGFSPKLLLRRQRFLRSLAQFMLDPSLTWISTLDWQYVDQAHFVRDFKRFMGMNPSQYAAREHPVLRAAARARAAAAGAAVQILHAP